MFRTQEIVTSTPTLVTPQNLSNNVEPRLPSPLAVISASCLRISRATSLLFVTLAM